MINQTVNFADPVKKSHVLDPKAVAHSTEPGSGAAIKPVEEIEPEAELGEGSVEQSESGSVGHDSLLMFKSEEVEMPHTIALLAGKEPGDTNAIGANLAKHDFVLRASNPKHTAQRKFFIDYLGQNGDHKEMLQSMEAENAYRQTERIPLKADCSWWNLSNEQHPEKQPELFFKTTAEL